MSVLLDRRQGFSYLNMWPIDAVSLYYIGFEHLVEYFDNVGDQDWEATELLHGGQQLKVAYVA